MTSFEQAIESAKILSDKKARNLSVIKIGEVSSLADYMVLATGNNSTHVKALADELMIKLKAKAKNLKLKISETIDDIPSKSLNSLRI